MIDTIGDFRIVCPVREFNSSSSGDVVDTAITLELGELFENVVGVAIGLSGHQPVRYLTRALCDSPTIPLIPASFTPLPDPFASKSHCSHILVTSNNLLDSKISPYSEADPPHASRGV
jgi:hypothetical protein